MRLSRDSVLGVLAVAIAAAYLAEASRIQQSLLADAVGADGVPRALAYGLGATGLLLVGREVVWPAAAAADGVPLAMHVRAAGLLALLAGYVVFVPLAGYPVAVAALIAAVALYAGARPGLTLLLTSVSGAAVFWIMFRWLLGVPMPTGVLGWG